METTTEINTKYGMSDYVLGVGAPLVLGGLISGLIFYFTQNAICAQAEKSTWTMPLVIGIGGALVFGIIGYFFILPNVKKMSKSAQETMSGTI